MDRYSIDGFAEKIYHDKTKEYFEEVLINYQTKSYRSSVVMLWSVVISDLIYKLRHLEDVYDDDKAKSILQGMKSAQAKDPKSSTWELKLIERTWKETQLLSSSNYVDFEYLQQQRHLSAHPVLDEESILHCPSKDTVRALIRSSLEGLLIKPPFLAKNILKEILIDLSENKEGLDTYKKIGNFVKSKYISRLSIGIKGAIFRSLWKLVFKTEDANCVENRIVNLGLLASLWEEDAAYMQSLVEGDKIYYGNISSNPNVIAFFINFVSNRPYIYELLRETIQGKVENAVDKSQYCKLVGWFINGGFTQHYVNLKEYFEAEREVSIVLSALEITKLMGLEDSEEWLSSFCKLMSVYYGTSRSFNTADVRFNAAIKSYIKYFSREDFIFLLEQIEGNGQTHYRGWAFAEHGEIKDHYDNSEWAPIDFTEYPRFAESIRLTQPPVPAPPPVQAAPPVQTPPPVPPAPKP